MVKFYPCDNRFDSDNSKEILNNLVTELNSKFKNQKCPLHNHDEVWQIGVDLTKEGKLQFHSDKQNGCDFYLTLIKNEVTPYLKKEQKWPLPLH